MANRYWVGGTGSWDDTAHWSATSGGSSGASAPSSSDSVYFDANSGGGVVTTKNGMVAGTFSLAGFAGTFSGAVGDVLSTYGNTTLANISGLENVALSVVSSATLTLNGATFYRLSLGSGATTINIVGDIVAVSSLTFNNGTINTGSYNITADTCTVQNFSTVNAAGGTWSITDRWVVNGGTFSAGTMRLVFTGTQFYGGNFVYDVVELNSSCTINTGFTAARLKTTAATSKTFSFVGGITVNATDEFLSGTTTVRHSIRRASGTTPFTVNSATTKNVFNLSVQNCTATGAAWICQNGVDGGGNTGWAFYNSTGAIALF